MVVIFDRKMRVIKKYQLSSKDVMVDNWVMRDSQPEGFQIDESSFLKMETHEYLPIPLTEDWFAKRFSATEHPVVGCPTEWQIFIEKLDVEFNWDNETGLVIFLSGSNDSISLDHIQYVHQFQNLYFDISNEELTIK